MSIRIGDKIIASVSNKDTANKDLSNITILGQQVINNPYPRFCVNSGSIDEEGNPNFIEINDLTITAKAPFVFTTTRGKTIQVNTDITETLSESFSGEIFLKPTNDSVSFVFGGEYFIQRKAPENPIENYTIWVDTSIFPEIAYLYTVNNWEETDLVPIGTVTIGEVEEPTEPTEPEEEPTEPILPEEGPIEVTPATISASDYASLTSYDETALYVLSDSGNEVTNTTSLTEENYESLKPLDSTVTVPDSVLNTNGVISGFGDAEYGVDTAVVFNTENISQMSLYFTTSNYTSYDLIDVSNYIRTYDGMFETFELVGSAFPPETSTVAQICEVEANTSYVFDYIKNSGDVTLNICKADNLEVILGTISISSLCSKFGYSTAIGYFGGTLDLTKSYYIDTEGNKIYYSSMNENTLYALSNNDTTINNTVALTQEEYDALEVKNENTLYMIKED